MKARRFSWYRGATMALAAALIFVLVGDRATSAPPPGIDPLEVLDLQVKPNVIIVLDSSGSMVETVLGNTTDTGDDPRSKLGTAKIVLNQVIAANQDKAAFLFGQYTSDATRNGTGRGGDRWFYGTDSAAFPSMLAQEVVLDYYAFQTITALNNTFVFGEEIGASGTAEAICSFTVPVGFYTPGAGAGTMANQLQTMMNAAACAPARTTPNTYTVVWNAGSTRFDYTDSGGGTHRWRIRWGHVPIPTIRGVLTNNVTVTPAFSNNAATYNAGATLRITHRDTTMKYTETGVTHYSFRSTRFWNGQTLHVLPPPSLTVCAVTLGAPGDGSAANPWYVNVAVRNTCGGVSGAPVKFTFFGSQWGGNNISCNGFQQDVPLIPCDQTTPTQISTIGPFLEPQAQVTFGNTGTTCAGVACPITGYQESTDGLFNETSPALKRGISSAGSTPIIQTILDVKGTANNLAGRPQRNFTQLWLAGQAANPGPPPVPALTPISTHTDPKESTILIFVTDGDPTCKTISATDANLNNLALGSAWAAEQLFKRINAAEPASSVITYLVAFGNGASVTRANWIGWGGSGLTSCMVASINGGVGAVNDPAGTTVACTNSGPPGGANDYIRWAVGPTAAQKTALCPTCQDAYVAPDAATLATVLQAIINQGASSGEFSAQQSVTSNVFEFTDQIPGNDTITGGQFGPANPGTRYHGFVPTKFVSTFTIPGFLGQFKAFTDINGDGLAEQQWSAGDKLVQHVQTGMATCNSSGTLGQCTFLELHANASDATINTSAAHIKRRIYTTSGNNNFALTAAQVIARISPSRVALWPPVPDNIAPASNSALGKLDLSLSLPLTTTAADFTSLQTLYNACKGIGAGGVAVDAAGSGHPCSASNPAATRAGRARREAREMILAFAAGASYVADAAGNPKRLLSGTSEILYSARAWPLVEGTLSTPAVVAPPVADDPLEEPAPGSPETPGAVYNDEYRIFRDGLRDSAGVSAGDAVDQGFGLRNPDRDSLAPSVPNPPGPPIPGDDSRQDLKPVMSVVYLGTNLMLHAFRAGPCTAVCSDTGGEELWAFVPYDQLAKVTSRYLHKVQPRDPHDYVIAASLRFADVFVPHPAAGPPLNFSIGGVDINTACGSGRCDGVWRRILYVGRGIAGKSWTALDVTGPELYTHPVTTSNPPLVYWSRGNPDTTGGILGGTPVNGGADGPEYATMGQTWSVPAINFVDKALPNGGGVDFVLNMGSGFGAVAAEGHNYYAVDALTGNMIASVDVDAAAAAIGPPFARTSPPFPNAIVTNVAGFNRVRFLPGRALHPARGWTTRNYVGDQHGHLWKFLTAAPGTALPVADIGADQPIGAPVALFGLTGNPPNLSPALGPSDLPNVRPGIFGSSGNDNRVPATGLPIPTFKNFAFFDTAGDTDVTLGTQQAASTPAGIGINFFAPNIEYLFANFFETNFRGTLQPTTAALDLDNNGIADGQVVFFGGTRFNPPGSIFAPPGPSSPGGSAPCRSSFDSIVYALEVNAGGAAFDLDGSPGNDPFTIFQDSRLVGLFTTYTPETGAGGKLVLDEGLVKGPVAPPAPAGQPLGNTTTNYAIVQGIQAGSPAPSVRLGSTVCQ